MENSRKLKTSFLDCLWLRFRRPSIRLYYVHFWWTKQWADDEHRHWMHTSKMKRTAFTMCAHKQNSWMHRRIMMCETKKLAKEKSCLGRDKIRSSRPKISTISLICSYAISASFGVVSTHSIAASHFMCARIASLCLCEHIYLSFFSFPFACLSLHSSSSTFRTVFR